MSTNPEKSAAERARELLAGVPSHMGMIDAANLAAANNLDALMLFAESPTLLSRLLQDLSAATERAEKAERELAALQLDHGLLEVRRGQLASQLVACENALCEREQDLATSRAAHDKTRQEADAQLGWVGLARPVVDLVQQYQAACQAYCAEGDPDRQTELFAAVTRLRGALAIIPLPTKET